MRQFGRGVPAGLDRGKAAFEFGVALAQHLRVIIDELQVLLECKEMFGLPGARQGFRDLIFTGLATGEAQAGQLERITFTRDNGADNRLAGLAHHIADHGGQLQIHLQQRLLHVQDVRGAMLDQGGAVTEQTAQGAHLGIGSKRAAQQAQTVQLLNPLAIEHVALATGHMLEMPTIDQKHFEAARFEHFKDRNPVDARGFHGDRVDATGDQPIGQGV